MCIYCTYLHVHTFTYQKLEMFKGPSIMMFLLFLKIVFRILFTSNQTF